MSLIERLTDCLSLLQSLGCYGLDKKGVPGQLQAALIREVNSSFKEYLDNEGLMHREASCGQRITVSHRGAHSLMIACHVVLPDGESSGAQGQVKA